MLAEYNLAILVAAVLIGFVVAEILRWRARDKARRVERLEARLEQRVHANIMDRIVA